MGTSVFLESLIQFGTSNHVPDQQEEEWRTPPKLCGERRAPSCAAPAEELPPLAAQPSTTARYSCPEPSSDPATPHNKTSFTGTQNTLNSQATGPPHRPESVKYLSYSHALWAPQQSPRLPSSFLLHPFQAAFPNRTPTKTILHKLQQPFPEIPHKPYRNPAADS